MDGFFGLTNSLTIERVNLNSETETFANAIDCETAKLLNVSETTTWYRKKFGKVVKNMF